MREFLIPMMALMVGVGCVGDKGVVTDVAASAPPQAATLPPGFPILALTAIDAPGFNVSDLTARLRDAMVHTSGAVIVDDVSVRAEIAACVEMPCKETEQARFREASLVGSATLSRVGQTLIGSVRVQSGLKELVRVNGQGVDAGAVVQQMGFDAGAMLRAAISASAPPQLPPPPEER